MEVLLIDGLNLVRRIYAAVPAQGDSSAHFEGFLHSVERSVERALRKLHPSHALAVFEDHGRSWRHRLHPAYKADRPPLPTPLAEGMGDIEMRLAGLGVRSLVVPGFEADDVLASIAQRLAGRGASAIIASTDKSMLALLGPKVRVRNHFEDRDLDADYVRERFGISPAALPDYIALVGDSGQGIPGVRGVGAKTAARLLTEHGSLEQVLAAGEEMEGRVGEALRTSADDARLSLELATLDTSVEAGLNLNECRLAPRTP